MAAGESLPAPGAATGPNPGLKWARQPSENTSQIELRPRRPTQFFGLFYQSIKQSIHPGGAQLDPRVACRSPCRVTRAAKVVITC